MRKNIVSLTFLIALLFQNCGLPKYSFTGISIAPEVKTVSIQNFPNHAPLVQPSLSQDLTEALKEAFISQTNLELVTNGIGDLNFEGQITDYRQNPQAISGDEQASMNRLTITVQLKFTNFKQPDQNFELTFSRFADYPTTQSFDVVEMELNQQIIEELVEDIFNKSVANW